LRWLKNISGVYITQVSLLLIGLQDLVHFFSAGIGPGETPGENNKYSTNYS
jgi:hypothetical protein